MVHSALGTLKPSTLDGFFWAHKGFYTFDNVYDKRTDRTSERIALTRFGSLRYKKTIENW